MLLRNAWTEQEAEHFVGVVALAAGDEEWRSRATNARTTARRLAENAKATGGPRLTEMVGKEVVNCVAEWLALDRRETTADDQDLGLTDLGNAKRFRLTHGNEVRFCHHWGKWLSWDGRRWTKDETGDAQRRAKRTALDILVEAAAEFDDERRKKLLAWQKQSEFENRIRAFTTLAKSEEGIPIRIEDLDRDTMLFNCQNGTLNLLSGEFRAHRREDLITKLAPVIYDENAKCPRWLEFLNRVMNGNEELAGFLQRTAGY